jgi:hypothetical protein
VYVSNGVPDRVKPLTAANLSVKNVSKNVFIGKKRFKKRFRKKKTFLTTLFYYCQYFVLYQNAFCNNFNLLSVSRKRFSENFFNLSVPPKHYIFFKRFAKTHLTKKCCMKTLGQILCFSQTHFSKL